MSPGPGGFTLRKLCLWAQGGSGLLVVGYGREKERKREKKTKGMRARKFFDIYIHVYVE